MRVTEKTNFETVRGAVGRAKSRMESLQIQSSTAKKLNTPSDDPVGAVKILSLRSQRQNDLQFQENLNHARTLLELSDQALGEISELVLRARDLALSQSSSVTANDQSREAVAAELHQLTNQLINVLNLRSGERYLFGGFQTQQPPVDAEGHYEGDDGTMQVEVGPHNWSTTNIAGSRILSMALPLDSSTPEGEEGEVPLFLVGELRDLETAMRAGDSGAIQASLEPLEALFIHLTGLRAETGARIQGLAAVEQALERQSISQAALASQIQDADLVELSHELALQDQLLKASLSTAGRLLQPTLLDFLR